MSGRSTLIVPSPVSCRNMFAQIEIGATYVGDAVKLIARLESAYRESMLEYSIEGSRVARCFIDGSFRVFRKNEIQVENIRAFLRLLKESSPEAQRIILANLCARLDSKDRYDENNEIPF